jgi:hypothetical protein
VQLIDKDVGHLGPAGPGHPGPFVGTWIEIAAMAVAVVAGIAALAVGNRRLAGA